MHKASGKHKQVKHYHEPGDFHELTFSCYCQQPLLTNDLWRGWLARAIDAAALQCEFHLIAFVFMPEHVHLLALPTRPDTNPEDIASFLAAVKRPVSRQVRANLEAIGSRLLQKLTIRNRPGSTAFRFWQEGPGYDRNMQTEKAVMNAIDYIHLNPVRRGLVKTASDWKWSSAQWYLSDGQLVYPDSPVLHFPPPELFYTVS